MEFFQEKNIFDNIWVQPAAGDAGGALGAALAAWHISLNKDRFHSDQQDDEMSGSYLGPSFSNSEIEDFLKIAEQYFISLMSKN
jgi:carbamoyltransferase